MFLFLSLWCSEQSCFFFLSYIAVLFSCLVHWTFLCPLVDTGGGRLSWPSILQEARCVSNGTKQSLMEQKVASTVLLPRVSLWAQDTALPLRRKDASTAVSWLLGPGGSPHRNSLPFFLSFLYLVLPKTIFLSSPESNILCMSSEAQYLIFIWRKAWNGTHIPSAVFWNTLVKRFWPCYKTALVFQGHGANVIHTWKVGEVWIHGFPCSNISSPLCLINVYTCTEAHIHLLKTRAYALFS